MKAVETSRPRLVGAIAWILCGCGAPDVELLTGVHDVAGENPLVPEIPLYPWPSDQFLTADPATDSGLRVDLTEAELPDGFLPEMFESHDGFSRMPAMLAWLPGGFDPATLPDASMPGATTEHAASVMLIEHATGARVPALVELDLTVDDPEQRSLIIRPHQVLAPAAAFSAKRCGTSFSKRARSSGVSVQASVSVRL